MKLRMAPDSIRLRLGQSEVLRLLQDGTLTASILFPSGSLQYVLVLGNARAIAADFKNGAVKIQLPKARAEEWAFGSQVGMKASQIVEEIVLEILVEKDFECLHPSSGESQADAFPNPSAGTASVGPSR